MNKRLIAAFAVAALVFSGCTKSTAPEDSVSQPTDQINQEVENDATAENMAKQCAAGTGILDRPVRIVTSVAPVTSLVGQMVAGTDVVVQGIIPETANSHTYVLTPADTAKIAQADIIISIGLNMENGFAAAAQTAMKPSAVICELGTAAVQKSDYVFDATFTQDAGMPNPHVWLNPQMFLRFLNYARDAVTTVAMAAQKEVDDNYVRISQEILALDQAMTTATATVPDRHKSLYMFHDSLAYFAQHFKFDMGLVYQPPTMEDPTPVQVADAIAMMKNEGAVAYFANSEFPGAFNDEVAKGAGVKVSVISDEHLPGKPGSAAHTVGAMIKDDFVTIIEALGGDATAVKAVKIASGAKDRATYGG